MDFADGTQNMDETKKPIANRNKDKQFSESEGNTDQFDTSILSRSMKSKQGDQKSSFTRVQKNKGVAESEYAMSPVKLQRKPNWDTDNN